MGHLLQAGPTTSLRSLLKKKRAGASTSSLTTSLGTTVNPTPITKPSPESKELLEPSDRLATLPAPSWLLQIKSDHLAGSLTTAPAPWGPFGVVSAMEGAHARVRDAATRKRNQCQRGAPAPVTGFSAGATSRERPARTPTPSRETSSPQHQCGGLPRGHP